MTANLASPQYAGDLGNGLVCRWSTAADLEKIAHCMATVYRGSADDPLNVRAANEARVNFLPGYPLSGPGDVAVVEDTSQPDQPVVACTFYWRHHWSLGGISFAVGRPEYVATLPEYRNRGLIRRLFEMVHARSAERGDLVQAITGIEYYYRQFGYEYVLDLDGRRMVQAAAVPPYKGDAPEPYRLRPATADDVPRISALYDLRRAESLVWMELAEADWLYFITLWDEPLVRSQKPGDDGVGVRVHVVVDTENRFCGYAVVSAKRRTRGLGVAALDLLPDVNWQAAMPSVLRALCEIGRQTPLMNPDAPPFDELVLVLGRTHRAYTVLGESLAPRAEPVYAWYLRVADVPGFVRHIAPVLEGRLASSILAGYSGETNITFYRGGMRLQFEAGKLVTAEPWRAPAYGNGYSAGCPELVFLQLIFGYRSLAELRAFLMDVQAEEPTALLLNILFPKQESHISALAYT